MTYWSCPNVHLFILFTISIKCNIAFRSLLNLCKRWLIALYYCFLCAMRSRLPIFLLLPTLVRTMSKKFYGLLPKGFGDSAKSCNFLRFSGYIRIDEQNGWLLRVQHTLCVTEKIQQYWQESTCAWVSFLSCRSQVYNLIKKETLAQRFSCKFLKMFKNTFFPDHFWMTASALKQLLALYFPIIYS